jgi:lipopolysaccharide transport protein LptA
VRRLLPTALGLLALAAGPAAAAGEGDERVALGVAPFEIDSPPGAAVPDVARLLAERLGTRDDARIVGPGELGAEADAEADSSAVQAWASGSQLDAVVLGRTTRTGSRISVDVRLREGGSGALAESFVQEIESPGELEGAVALLASRVMDGTVALRAAPASAPARAASADGGEGPFALDRWKSDEPLAIESEQLDVTDKDGRRHLLFEGKVRAVQGDLTLEAARLEAVYPEGGGDPDRLVAGGGVRLAQGDQHARCDSAVYDRVRKHLTCSGNASFQEGDSTLAGQVIEIDLAAETVKVKGGASVVIEGEEAAP